MTETRAKWRVVFGAVDVGYRIQNYRNFFKKHYGDQIHIKSVVIDAPPWANYKVKHDFQCQIRERSPVVRWLIHLYIFFRHLFYYNIFYFISGETFLPRKLRGLEFFIYKLLGKRVVMHFVGADIRSPQYSYKLQERLVEHLKNPVDIPIQEPHNKAVLSLANRFADYQLVSTPDLLSIAQNAIYFPVVIDLERFEGEVDSVKNQQAKNPQSFFDPQLKDAVRIMHCPSNVRLKGSPYIHEALLKLKTKLGDQIDLFLPAHQGAQSKGTIYTLNRQELLGAVSQSHILIDQLVIGWYGLQSIEALLLGNTVLCYLEEGAQKHAFPGSPIINANALNLYEKCVEAVDVVKNQKSDVSANRQWVKKYHTLEGNHEALIDAIEKA